MKQLGLFFFFLLVLSCEKIPENPVYGPVNLRLDLLNRDKDLRMESTCKVYPRNWAGLNYNERVGMGGIVVVHTVDTWSAFDLACPNEPSPNPNAIVVVDTDGIYAVCSQCGTKYQIFDGSGINLDGKKYHLRSYRVSLTGQFTGIVTNI